MNQITLNRNSVHDLEAIMLQSPQVNLLVKHHFSDNVYARELHIPKGVLLTGHIHKYTNLNILAKGKIKLVVDNQLKEVSAPFVVVSPAGTKRAALALEDCVWITIHGTEEKDLNLIENKFIAHSEQEYLEFVGTDQLALPGFDDDKLLR